MKNILPPKEYQILRKLKSPARIQDFLDKMPINPEKDGDTCYSPMAVLHHGICHCIEGAVLAALALRVQGLPPLVVDLTASKNDFDHVISVFNMDGKWGAISKTNHAALRYREPIYNSIRELVMSYFHEYLDDLGRKNLRSYTMPINLKRFDKTDWMTSHDEIDHIVEYLADAKHYPILTRKHIRNLRLAHPIEIRVGKIAEWKI